jgi:hypothetical protein
MAKKILKTWTNLKPKLSKLVYLSKHKELIKAALEVYCHQSSSWLTLHTQEDPYEFINIPPDYQITPLIEPTTPITEPLSSEWKEYLGKQRWNAYLSQQAKNKAIVKKCKEVLGWLEE